MKELAATKLVKQVKLEGNISELKVRNFLEVLSAKTLFCILYLY